MVPVGHQSAGPRTTTVDAVDTRDRVALAALAAHTITLFAGASLAFGVAIGLITLSASLLAVSVMAGRR